MKKTISYMMAAASALFLLSCNREVIVSGSYGYLSLNAESDLSTDIIVKSSSEDMVFSVDINNGAGQTVAHFDDHRTINAENPVKLQVGTYEVTAYKGENLNAAFDNPYYEGKEKVKILPDKVQNVSLTCALANSMFSVEFTDDFATNFPEYKVSVTNGVGDKLVLTNSPEAGNPLEAGFTSKAYLAVTGTLSWELELKNVEGGIYKTSMSYDDVVAKSHYHIKFELGPEEDADGAVFVKVIVDSNLEEVHMKYYWTSITLPFLRLLSQTDSAQNQANICHSLSVIRRLRQSPYLLRTDSAISGFHTPTVFLLIWDSLNPLKSSEPTPLQNHSCLVSVSKLPRLFRPSQ